MGPVRVSEGKDTPGTKPGMDSGFACYLVETIGQGLLVTGERWRFEYVNPAFAKLVGCSTEDLIGKSMDDFIHHEDLEILKDARRKRMAGETTSYEVRLVSSDRQVVYVQITGTPRWQEDKVAGSISVITNLTEHYIREQERRIYERTAALARSNEVLLAEIVERKRAEEVLNMSLKEKEVLLREIHHKVKNNLQLISCLIYLQSRKGVEETPQDIVQDCLNRVKSMAIVHEKLSGSENLAKINLADYVKSLVDYLFQFYNVPPDRIALDFDVAGIMIGVDTAVSCGFVINELVSNSIKHAFPKGQKGEIGIEFHPIGEGFQMVIRDNGAGFKTDQIKTTALGLQFVRTVVKHINGNLKIDGNRGTRLEIDFQDPINKELS